MTGTSTGAAPPATAREPEHLTRNRRVDAAHTPRRQNQMKSIAQIVQNNRRLLAAYQDKVQPRFLSRYAREPMDAAAVDGLGARTEFHVADVLAPLAGEPGRTDEIWVCGALHQMKDAGAALGRVAGLLADGGIAYVQTLSLIHISEPTRPY